MDPNTFDRGSLITHIVESLSLTAALIPLLAGVCLIRWMSLMDVLGGVVFFSVFLAPLIVFTAFSAALAAGLICLVADSLDLALRPACYGPLVGTLTSVPFVFPWLMSRSPGVILVPILLGFLFQVGGAVGAKRFERKLPLRSVASKKFQFEIRQIMVATAWIAVVVTMCSVFKPTSQMVRTCSIWVFAQLALGYLIQPSLTRFACWGSSRIPLL